VIEAFPAFLRPQLSTLFARSCATEDIAKVEAFIRPRLATLGGGELELEQTKQRIALCAALRKAKQGEIGLRPREWCTSRKSWLRWTRTQLTTADNRAG